ncbi:MAG: DUF87 domain-containing protein [Acidobacteria bacterium]|nr:DUF87 domain-containing protein [Acidobacteriota bacterium]
MSIQINQIRGDTVELIFNPREEDLRVGQILSLVERTGGHQGLVVQIIEFRTVTYPALIQEQLQLAIETAQPLSSAAMEYLSKMVSEGHSDEMKNLKIAVAKIRNVIGKGWDLWDGWIPTRDVEITQTSDKEVFTHCVDNFGNMLTLGSTLQGVPFCIDGQNLEKINIITGVKGSGKSHLAKVILLELIQRGAPCVVFDINKEYIHLPPHRLDPSTGQIVERGILHLKAGKNLKLSVRQFGLAPLVTMLTRFGMPEVSAMYFENRLARLLHEAEAMEAKGQRPPFIGIDQLIQMANENEFGPNGDRGNSIVNGAIRSRLEALKNTRVFATHPDEAISFHEQYDAIRNGGALVIDISVMSNLARVGFVQAIIEMIKEICEREITRKTNRFPFVFFEEAHLYVYRHTIDYIVTRARHLGISSFFVTNMVTGLDEAVLRQADNLFLLHLPFDDDVRHVGKSAFLDQESVSCFVRRLRHHHALVIGRVTRMFPMIIRVDELKGINTAGETQYFFTSRPNHRRSSLPERSPSPSLPLAGAPGANLDQVAQVWRQVVDRVCKQRPLLGSFLAEGKLKDVSDNEVRLAFSARQKIGAEMIAENKSLIEQELAQVLQMPMRLQVEGVSDGPSAKRASA